MPALDPAALVSDMQSAATAAIGKDVSSLQGFAVSQLQGIAQQAVYFAEGVADGSITRDSQDYYLDSLKEMARSFVNTLEGLVVVMIEAAWNAIVGAVWGAINKATGLALAVPLA